MNVFSLLYAGKSIIAAAETEAQVDAVVGVGQSRNRDADVTGCLIFADGRFAQVLEGEQRAVEDIMASIARDGRHTDVTGLAQGNVYRLGAGLCRAVGIRAARDLTTGLRGSSWLVAWNFGSLAHHGRVQSGTDAGPVTCHPGALMGSRAAPVKMCSAPWQILPATLETAALAPTNGSASIVDRRTKRPIKIRPGTDDGVIYKCKFVRSAPFAAQIPLLYRSII